MHYRVTVRRVVEQQATFTTHVPPEVLSPEKLVACRTGEPWSDGVVIETQVLKCTPFEPVGEAPEGDHDMWTVVCAAQSYTAESTVVATRDAAYVAAWNHIVANWDLLRENKELRNDLRYRASMADWRACHALWVKYMGDRYPITIYQAAAVSLTRVEAAPEEEP